jgi:hypothetical protein
MDLVGKVKNLKRVLLYFNNIVFFIDDPKLVFSSPHPTALQHGIAKDLTADMFSSADYLDYTDGIICVVCL